MPAESYARVSRPATERNALALANDRLAFAVASKRHRQSNPDFDDTLQSARLGLIRAAEDWDPSRAAYSTWAHQWIRRFTLPDRRRRLPDALSLEGDVEEVREETDDSRELVEMLLNAACDPSTAELVAKRFGLGGRPTETLREIGAAMGISHQAVGQRIDRALRRMRRVALERNYL